MQKLSKYYTLFFIAITLILGAAIVFQVISIYFTGTNARESARSEALKSAEEAGLDDEQTQIIVAAAVESISIYSREIVGKRLIKLIPFAAVWLAAFIFRLWLASKYDMEEKDKRKHSAAELMLSERLRKDRLNIPKEPKSGREEEFERAISDLRQCRTYSFRLNIAMATATVICVLPPFWYFIDRSHFPNNDLNGEVVHSVLFALPFLALMLCCGILYVNMRHKLEKKESDAVRLVRSSGDGSNNANAEVKRSAFPKLYVVRGVMLAVGVTFVVVGVLNGSASEVLAKAIKICTECIGLG